MKEQCSVPGCGVGARVVVRNRQNRPTVPVHLDRKFVKVFWGGKCIDHIRKWFPKWSASEVETWVAIQEAEASQMYERGQRMAATRAKHKSGSEKNLSGIMML